MDFDRDRVRRLMEDSRALLKAAREHIDRAHDIIKDSRVVLRRFARRPDGRAATDESRRPFGASGAGPHSSSRHL